MFAKNLTKQAYNGEWLQRGHQAVNYHNPAYQNPYSNQPQQPQGQAPIGMAGLLSALMMAPPRAVKKQDNLYDFAMANKNNYSNTRMAKEFTKRNAKYAAEVAATRKALHDAGGYGFWQKKHSLDAALNPKLIRDAIMTEPHMNKRMHMVEALRAEQSPAGRKALALVLNTKGLIDPSKRERFWKVEPGKATVGSRLSELHGATNTPGTLGFDGTYPAAMLQGARETFDMNKSRIADFFSQKNAEWASRPTLQQRQAQMGY